MDLGMAKAFFFLASIIPLRSLTINDVNACNAFDDS